MTDNTDNLVIRHLQELRAEMRDRFKEVNEKLDELAVTATELRGTQSAMLQIMSTHESRLLRIEGDVKEIRKRLDLVDADA